MNTFRSAIVELFAAREEVYEEMTQEILHSISHVVLAINEIMARDNESNINERMEWRGLQLADNFIVFVGLMSLVPGESVINPMGNEITVTPEMIKDAKKVIRVGIPLELVEHGSTEDIKEFLRATEDQRRIIREQEQGNLVTNSNNEGLENVGQVANTADNIFSKTTGFDTSELSDEQLRQLLTHEKVSRGKIH